MEQQVVLVVEDDPSNREVVELVLRDLAGVRVASATNGVDALRLAREIKPDLILLDLGLPRPNGLEVTRELRSDPRTQSIPIIAVSANVQVEYKSVEIGCDEFIMKPFDVDTVLQIVRKYLVGGLAGGVAPSNPPLHPADPL